MKDVVICAWAAPCSGPGWSNQPVRYIALEPSGRYREEWIQPEDVTPAMWTLYRISAAVNDAMVRAVEAKLREAKP